MASATESDSLRLRGGPPILAGAPRRVSGHLEIENAGDADVLLTSVEVVETGLRLRSATDPVSVPLLCVLPAGRSTRVPLRLRLDRTTPPGRHEMTISAGGAITTVVVDVAAQPRARISPPAIALRGAPGATLTQGIVVSNLGNVPIPLDRLGAVRIEERGAVCRSLGAALNAEGEHGVQAFLDQAVREMAQTRVDMMRLRVGDTAPLDPGQTRAVELELRLPADLHPGLTYAGLIRIVDASLGVEVTALGIQKEADDDVQASVPPAPRRRARRSSPGTGGA